MSSWGTAIKPWRAGKEHTSVSMKEGSNLSWYVLVREPR
jgi:hypothetical protein